MSDQLHCNRPTYPGPLKPADSTSTEVVGNSSRNTGVLNDDRISTGYAVASGMIDGVAAINAVLSEVPSFSAKWAGAVGVGSGWIGTVLGATKFDNSGDAQMLCIVNFAVGLASTGLGVFNLLGSSTERAAVARSEQPAVTPTIAFTPRGEHRLGVNVRF